MTTTIELLTVAFAFALLPLFFLWRTRSRREVFTARAEARTDEGTGIGNRRAWRERVAFLDSVGEDYSFVVFDVANLKAANTALGHAAADQILRQVAQVLRKNERGACRIGGDEFAVALPGVPLKDAEALCVRVEREVGAISVGRAVVFLVGSAGFVRSGKASAQAMDAADFALERKKGEIKARNGLPLTRDETLASLEE